MEAGAAGDDGDRLDLVEDAVGGQAESRVEYAAVLQPAFQGFRHGARLGEDFLEHVMPVAGLVRRIGRQFGQGFLARHLGAGLIVNVDLGARDLGDVAFFQENEALGHRQQREHVRCNKIFANAQPDHERAAAPRDDNFFRVVTTYHPEGVSALEIKSGFLHGGEQIRALLEVVINPVHDHFGVGLGIEFMSRGDLLGAQFLVVFDDAVVHQCDLFAAQVGMGIIDGGLAVGSPASVRDAETTAMRGRLQGVFEAPYLARHAQATDTFRRRHHGQTSRIVTPVLKTFQSFEQDRSNVTLRYCTDYSTHKLRISRKINE